MLQQTASPLRAGALALTLGIVALAALPYRVTARTSPVAVPVVAPAAAPTPAVAARASVRPPSQPPRTALTWRPEREAAAEQLAARLLVLPLFQELDPESRRRYAREASLLDFAAGEVMVPAPAPGERAAVPLKHALSQSFAFGGSNAALLLSSE